MTRRLRALGLAATLGLAAPAAAGAAVPPGFTETVLATGLDQPAALAPAPDGRVFVAEQSGAVKIVDGAGVTTALTLTVDSDGERGLIGIALHPQFPAVPRLYVHYSVPGPQAHNRVSWFTLSGTTLSGENVILDLPPLTNWIHNGGGLHFGPDGSLYIGVGDNGLAKDGTNPAPDPTQPLGKILRVNADGTPAPGNPFAGLGGTWAPFVWAKGLRNPYTFAFQPPPATAMLINDVGEGQWEEVNLGTAGADYGWPATEGPTSDPAYTSPLHAYPHYHLEPVHGCAISGGAFPAPAMNLLGADYFFADFCEGWVRSLDLGSPAASESFATGLGFVTDLAVGPDGALYVADWTGGRLVRLAAEEPPPAVPEGAFPILLPATALGIGPLILAWRRRQ